MSGGVGGAPLVLHDDEYDHQVFLDDSDIIHEVLMDDQDLPDALDLDLDDDDVDMNELHDDDDDSVHIFTRHKVFHASPGHEKRKEVYSVACSPKDATLVATGGGDDRVFLWRIDQEQNLVSELQGHNNSVSALAFSHDGQILASGDLDGKIQLWNEAGKLEHALTDGDIQWFRWHPMEPILLAGCVTDCVKRVPPLEYSVWMWNTNTADKYHKKLTGFGEKVTCGDFTPDGKSICTGSEDGSVRIVNINSRKVISTLVSHSGSTECVGFAPGSVGWAATGSTDQTLVIWDIGHSLDRATCNHEGAVRCLAWLDARRVATGCDDGKVRIWDSGSGECVRIFKGHSGAVESLSVSANKDYLVSASLDGTARVFKV